MTTKFLHLTTTQLKALDQTHNNNIPYENGGNAVFVQV
jgi:hypothetical protein